MTTAQPLVDKILDTAGQKGTGKWTGISSLELGHAGHADRGGVYSRVSVGHEGRTRRRVENPDGPESDRESPTRRRSSRTCGSALYCSKMISYAQGYMLLREAAKDQKWNLNFGGIALMWRGGCIIRSRFLGKIKDAYDKNPKLTNLLLDDFFSRTLNRYQGSWRARSSSGD